MSAAHRSLARLPLEIYTDLICERQDNLAEHPELLRHAICNKLKKFPDRSRSSSRAFHNNNGSSNVVFDSITTVGGLLTRISKPTLLRVLDPILTYEECDTFLGRVAHVCAPKPETALDLLNETQSLDDMISSSEVVLGTTTTNNNNAQTPFLLGKDEPFHQLRHLPTGLRSLDDCLRGGLRVGTITEVVGRAGAGKTQLAMQLCVMAARFRQGSIYIDTEKKLSLPRLREIAEQRATTTYSSNTRAGNGGLAATLDFSAGSVPVAVANPQHFSYADQNGGNAALASAAPALIHDQEQQNHRENRSPSAADISYRKPKEVLDNVTVLSPTTTSELLSALVEVEEMILVRNEEAMDAKLRERLRRGSSSPSSGSNHHIGAGELALDQACFPVRLLIVDSIAAPTKRGFGSEQQSAPERAAAVFQCAQRLKQLAHQLQVAVLVINQVSLEYHQHQQHRRGECTTAGNNIVATEPVDRVAVKAALGTSWHHCVSTRILLEQQQQGEAESTTNESGVANQRKRPRATRTATIVKSNVVGLQSTDFEVAGPGVVDANTL